MTRPSASFRPVIALAAAHALLALPRPASAQQETAVTGIADATQTAPPPIEVTVQGDPRKDARPSPVWATSRPFGNSRVWLLDPEQKAIEVWYSTSVAHNGSAGDNEHLWQLEYSMGIMPHVQLDVYFNYAWTPDRNFHIEGAQIEGRISLARYYGQIWGNPTLYLEWHPQTNGPSRGEVRVLLGGQLGSPRVFAAMNPYFEQNIDPGPDGKFTADREVGSTGAIAYQVMPGRLMVGGEIKAGADQQGTDAYKGIAKLGPSLWLNLFEGRFRITSSALFGVTARSDRFNPVVVLGFRL